MPSHRGARERGRQVEEDEEIYITTICSEMTLRYFIHNERVHTHRP